MTTREYAQTTELLSLHGIEHDVVGPGHGGAGAAGKARAMGGRLRALRSYARRAALRHRARARVARAADGRPLSRMSPRRMPSTTSSRASNTDSAVARRRASSFPDAIPQDRLDRLGARAAKVRRYPGLKEEYYLHGFAPDPRVLDELGIERERVLVVVRTPPDVSLYHRRRIRCSATSSNGSGATPRCRRRAAANGGAAGRDRRTRASVRPRARARDRRAEPRRALRPRRVGGRDDEP